MVGNFVAGLGRDVRRICKAGLQVFGLSIPRPAFEEVGGRLDRADLLRDRGCNPLVQGHPSSLARRAAVALIEAGNFSG